jgi:hypothetical protein
MAWRSLPASVRDYLAGSRCVPTSRSREKDGDVDVARMQTLAINIDKARGRVPAVTGV